MDMQDNVYLINRLSKKKKFVFRENELDINYQEIFENAEWKLVFQAPMNGKLYMDGLDLILDKRIMKKDDGAYIVPSEEPYYIYNHKQNDSKYLPGIYRLKLVTESTIKYSWLKILPKFVTENSLEIMRQDVENTVKGLARSFCANTNGNLSNYSSFLTFDEIQALSILNDSYKEFNLNSYFLANSPRVKAGAYYHWTKNKKRALDNKSIMKMSMEKKKDSLYLKDYRATVDTSENRILKRILQEILQTTTNIKRSIGKIPREQLSSDMKNDFNKLQKYVAKLNYLLNDGWLKKVKLVQKEKGISNAYLDHRYIFFRELNWKLKHISNFQPHFSRQYQYYWHRTDLLYEIWGYIKVIEALNRIGFIPLKGWIYNNDNLDFRALEPGTCVEMKSNESYKYPMYLKIKYDDEIKPDEKDKVTFLQPLWHSSSHNRPDIRLEIYDKNKVFQNAIILDTKYRRLKDMNNFGDRGVLDQLNAYRYQILSPYPLKDDKYKKYKDLYRAQDMENSVIDVAALYPGELNDNDESLSELKTKAAKSVILNPKFPNNNSLMAFLKDSFKQQEDNFEKFEALDRLLERTV